MSSDEEEYIVSGARCMKCSGRRTSDTNRLLICCEDECVNVLHEECMAARCQLDVIGYFRCPGCAAKRIEELFAQKEKLLEDSATKLGNWISRADRESRMEVDDEGETSGASARREFENVEGGERQEEREPMEVEPLLTVRLSDVQGRSNGDEGETSGASARWEFENVGGEERQEEREPMAMEPLLTVRLSDVQGETSGASARREFENVGGGERQEEEREPMADVQGRSNGDEGHGDRMAEEQEQQQQQENNGTRVLPQSFSQTFMSLGKRRVLWTEDEEKALEEGVKNIWDPATRKNIPWEKILVAYKDKFHSSRTAANLKDKWKTMTRAVKT